MIIIHEKDVGVDIKNKLVNGGRLKLFYNHYKRTKLKYLKDLPILNN